MERRHSPGLWPRGTFLLFGGVAAALVVFVFTLALILGRPGRETRTEAPRNVLRDLKVELGDRGAVDLQAKSLTVSLKFSGLPEDVARRMNVKVSVDGRDAQVSASGEGAEVTASATLEEKVENIVKSNGVGAVLIVKGSCEYGSESLPFDVSATRLQIVSKSEKNLALAFANFPEPTPPPRPVPRIKPTPTPSQTAPPPTPAPTPGSTPSSENRISLRREVELLKKQTEALAARMNNSNANVQTPEYKRLQKEYEELRRRLYVKHKQLNKPDY